MDWFRLYHEFATDPKVQSMSEAMQRIASKAMSDAEIAQKLVWED